MTYQVELNDGAIEYLMEQKDLLTRSELARTLDISRAMMSGIVNDKKTVGPAFIAGVYQAYGIGLDHFIYNITRKDDDLATPRLLIRR